VSETDFIGSEYAEAIGNLRQHLVANGWGSPEMTDEEVVRFAQEGSKVALEFVRVMIDHLSPVMEEFSIMWQSIANDVADWLDALPREFIEAMGYEVEMEEDYPETIEDGIEGQVTTVAGSWGGLNLDLVIFDESWHDDDPYAS